MDFRDEYQVAAAIESAAARFGGIDLLVNHASAISLAGTEATPIRRYDLMMGVNARGTFLVTQACLPFLKRSAAAGRNPHVLTLSPPLNMDPKWFAPHVAFTMAKYGMSMCVLRHAEEFRPFSRSQGGFGAATRPIDARCRSACAGLSSRHRVVKDVPGENAHHGSGRTSNG